MEISMNMVGAERIVESLQAQGKAAGLTVQHLAWEVMANACNDIIKYSPPRTSAGGSFSEQLKIGESAVVSDLNALFQARDQRDRLVFQNRTTGRWYIRPKARRGAGRWAKEVDPSRVVDAGGMPRVHRAAIGNRNRVRRNPPVHFVPRAALNHYIGEIKGHVGELKSGWLPAANLFSDLAKKKKKSAGWIDRHREPGNGTAAVTPEGDGYLRADNLSKWAGAVRRDAILWVTRKAERDIDKWLPIRAEKIAQRIARADASAGAVA